MTDLDPRLAQVAERLEATGWAAELADAEWRLVWFSDQLKAVMGESDDEALGRGLHLLEARELPAWRSRVTRPRYLEAMRQMGPTMAYDAGGAERLPRELPDDVREALAGVEPAEPPPLYTGESDWVAGEATPTVIRYIAARLYAPGGELLGTALLWGPDLPATLLALVARGDRRTFERMARLFEPARRATAIMFADLQRSGTLSRKLSTAAYFGLIREMTTAIDELVVRSRGIVGKHAGDGVTAFFLSEDLGSDSAAALAAIATARAVCDTVGAAAARMIDRGVPIEPGDAQVNVGLHFGGSLYVGQIVTGGRLEVTALGDEVNETARIQQAARDGSVLASKALVERLSERDAAALDLDPASIPYRTVGELREVPDKAVRDASAIPVADVGRGGEPLALSEAVVGAAG